MENKEQELPEEVDGGSLKDRLNEVEGVSDTTAEFLAENWQKILSFGVLVLVVVFLSDQYRVSQATRQGEASHKFLSVQKMYRTLATQDSSTELTDEMQRPLIDSVDVLERSYSGSVYSELAPLYLALLEAKTGQSVQEKLKTLGAQRFAGVTEPSKETVELTQEAILSELSALLYARALLDEGKLAEGITMLKEIAYGATLVNAEALMAMYRIAGSEEEKSSIQSLAKELILARPELTEVLKSEFSREGVNL